MWESPIKTICDEMRTQFEGEVLKAVRRVGIDVDKDELIKALNYDRNQYAEGYKDGYSYAKSELIRCKDCAGFTGIDHAWGACLVHKDCVGKRVCKAEDYCSWAERREE